MNSPSRVLSRDSGIYASHVIFSSKKSSLKIVKLRFILSFQRVLYLNPTLCMPVPLGALCNYQCLTFYFLSALLF